jgi:hypothetical protein
MKDCTNLLLCALEYSGQFFDIAFAIIASAIAAITPTPADDHLLAKAYRILDMFALNFGYAKEKPARAQGGRFVAK